MLKRFFTISLLFIIIVPALNSFSEDLKNRIKGAIIVTSETLIADNKAHTALFEKNVIAKTTDMTLYADRMLVYYKEDGGVAKIVTTGNVKLQKDARVITSEKATYYTDEDKIVFTGEPRAVDGDNVVTGRMITFFIKEDRSHVKNSKVFLKSKKGK